jgi:ATP-dependent Clp protease ATP-binding subunit ClpA
MLLGVLQAAPDTATRFMGPDWSVRRMLKDLVDGLPVGSKAATEVEIPFTEELDRALARAVQEADTLGNRDIQPEHLLLGLIHESSSRVERLLREAGITRESILLEGPRVD